MKKYRVNVNGASYDIEVELMGETESVTAAAPAAKPAAPAAAPAAGSTSITAPMPGTILSVNVQNGQSVKKGDVLMILEAMKMENEIVAPQDGTVASVNCRKGDVVNVGDLLVSLN